MVLLVLLQNVCRKGSVGLIVCEPVCVTCGHSCGGGEACEASDVIDGHLDQVESALQEVTCRK